MSEPGGWKYSTTVIQWDDIQTFTAGPELVSWFLKQIADCFVERGIWSYDTSIHTQDTNPIPFGSTSQKWTHACFFVNNQTGSKAMLGYSFTGSTFLTPYQKWFFSNNQNNYPQGLLFGMIPSGQGLYDITKSIGTREFSGNSDNAVPVLGLGCVNTNQTSSTTKASSSSMTSQGTTLASMYCLNTSCWCRYSFLQKDDCVVILTKNSKLYSVVPCVAVFGKILSLDSVMHPELEDDPASLYGAGFLQVRQVSSGFDNSYEETGGYCVYDNTVDGYCIRKNGSGPLGFLTKRPDITDKTYSDTQYFSEFQGPWLPVAHSHYFGNEYITYQTFGNSNAEYVVGPKANDGYARMCPCAIQYGNFYNQNQYVYESLKDNFRGFVRDDLLLLTNYQYTQGQTFGKGKYIYLTAGMVLGWDSDLNPGMTI